MGALPYRVGERFLNPLPDEASRTKWEPEKKDPLRGSFFSYRPLAGAAPRSVPTQQKVLLKILHMQQLLVNTQHTTTKLKHSEMQPRHVQCLHRIRMTYPIGNSKVQPFGVKRQKPQLLRRARRLKRNLGKV